MTKSRHRKSRWQEPVLAAGLVKQVQHKFYPLYAFGFEGILGKRGQIACLDSNLIVYSVGGSIIFHNVSSEKSMRFFSSSVAVEAILWVTSSPAGHFVAACERLKTGYHQVTVLDVKKLAAVQTVGGLAPGEYGACAFSENERLLISACNVEETAQVEYWDIRDGRVLLASVVPYTVNKITINPLDDEEGAMSGTLHFKFWSTKGGARKETSIQGLNGRHDQKLTLTDHVWLADSSVAISTAEGIILIVRDNAVQHKYMDTGCIICLYSTGREFFCGRTDGTLTQYTGFEMAKVKMQEKESPYTEVKCVTLLSGYSQISSIAMPPHGQKILYMVEGETVLKVHLDIADDEDALLGSEPNLARPVQLSVFTMKDITGIDVCEQRMIVVTCSSDKMIRVWNYCKMVCEITHLCDEEPQLVTVSPLGHYLFVTMSRCIQVYRIVGYKLQHCKNITGMKNIKQLKYSPSGHLVAAANAREIVLIDAFTWKVSSVLKGHTGVVTTLAWSSDSIYVASAGADGAIYAWFLDGVHRYLEYVIKGSIHTCLLFDPARTYIIACGPKLPIKVIDTDKKLGLSHGREFRLLPEELAAPSEPELESPAQMYVQSPRESEHSSVPGDLQGSAQGSHRGSVQGNHRGSVQGSHRGSVQASHRGSLQASQRGSVQGSHKGGVVQGGYRGSGQGSHRGSVQGSHRGGDIQPSGQESHRGSLQGSNRVGDAQTSSQESHRGSVQGSHRGGDGQASSQENLRGSFQGSLSVPGSNQGSNQESHQGSVQGSLGGGDVQGNQESHRGSIQGTHRGNTLGVVRTSVLAEIPPEKVLDKVETGKGEGSSLEGSWVQHRFRSNCIIELTHDKPVNFIVGLFKKGVLIAAGQNGDLRMYAYPFSHDKPNLLKEVTLFPSGEITGLCLDEERKLIFTSSANGILFVGSIDQDIVGPKEESADDFDTDAAPPEETLGPPMPLITHYLTDAGSDAHNLLLERDEVEEMKRDLIEFKLKMAREAKDAYFKHQRDALDWACEMKERETAFVAREKNYNVKIKLLEHNLHTAISDKETTIQNLLNAHSQTTQQLQDYFQDKLAQELDRSHISRKQAQKDKITLEEEMRSKENIYLEKIVALERQLEDADSLVEKRVAKVREECNKEIEHMKLELEEDILISDDELNKAFEKLNHDVGAEKERADSIYHSLMAEKRTVMHAEKQMKEMEEAHHLHVDSIQKLTKEVADLKKLATELDFEKRTLRQVLIETEEKSQHLVSERKDQETKTVVRDFKIEQLKKVEGPLKEATVDLRNKLREMESHQLGHVLEMKRQGLVAAALRAKIQNFEEEAEELHIQLHEKDAYIQMFTQSLCRLVQENDVAEWPQLIKQLYFTYVKEIHRTAVSEGSDTYSHLLHQRENLERFVAILKREIARCEARNWNDARHYMQQNLDLLHEFGEAQRNVRRLAFLSQKYQGEMAYWKSLAGKRCPSLFITARASLESPRLDQRSASNSRCSKTTPLSRHRPSSAVPLGGDSAAPFKRPTTGSTASSALQQANLESALLNEAERVREQSRSSTPVAGIVKPYEHRGSVPQAASLRFSFTQQQHQLNRPWSTDPATDIDRAKVLALNVEVIELRKQVMKKDREIQRLTRDQRRASGAYLPRRRSASIMANTPADEATAKSTAEEQPALPTRRPSTSAAPAKLPLRSLSVSNSSSRPDTSGGVVRVAGSYSATDAVIAMPGWRQAFPRENDIISMNSSAQITSPNSATGGGEQQPDDPKLSAVELLAERRVSYIHAAAERVNERRRSQSSTPGERRGSRVTGGEGGGERRLSATALVAERRASTLAIAATPAEIDPDLTLAATAAELSPRSISVPVIPTQRRNTFAAAEHAPRRSSTPADSSAPLPHGTQRRGSKYAAEAALAEQATRRASTSARAAAASPHVTERRGSRFATAQAEQPTRRVTTPGPAASNAPERLPSSTAASAEHTPNTHAAAADSTTGRLDPAIAATVETVHGEGASVTSSAEPEVTVSQKSSPLSTEVINPVVQGEASHAIVTVVETAESWSSTAHYIEKF